MIIEDHMRNHLQRVSYKDIKISIKAAMEEIDSSKNSRFNLGWFKWNKDVINQLLWMGIAVRELSDPRKYRLAFYQDKGSYVAKFYPLDKEGSFDDAMLPMLTEVRFTKKGYVLSHKKKKCIHEPALYVIANRLGIYRFPKNWEYVNTLKKDNGVSSNLKVRIDDKSLCIEFLDRYYNKVKIPLDYFDADFYHSIRDLRRLRGLKQFKNKTKELASYLSKKYTQNRYAARKGVNRQQEGIKSSKFAI